MDHGEGGPGGQRHMHAQRLMHALMMVAWYGR
jgi:hypothetical protein